MTEALTLELLKTLSNHDPLLRGLVERATSATYEDFLTILYDDIKSAVTGVTKQKHLIVNENEDATTGRISLFLQGAGYYCDCASSGGNVDIEIKRNGHRWIGEAKKYTSLTAVQEGYKQLHTRYTPGTDSTGISYGGLLAYLRRPNAVKYVNDWKEKFISSFDINECKITDCSRFGVFAFNSQHNHSSYGTPFNVWHVCLPLHHDPQDKSGNETRARREKKLVNTEVKKPTARKKPSKPD